VKKDCWATYYPEVEGPCPPCSNASLAWYFWLLIALGIVAVIVGIGAFLKFKINRRQYNQAQPTNKKVNKQILLT
jgi:hypothetical protein